jgi:hypothetical protein
MEYHMHIVATPKCSYDDDIICFRDERLAGGSRWRWYLFIDSLDKNENPEERVMLSNASVRWCRCCPVMRTPHRRHRWRRRRSRRNRKGSNDGDGEGDACVQQRNAVVAWGGRRLDCVPMRHSFWPFHAYVFRCREFEFPLYFPPCFCRSTARVYVDPSIFGVLAIYIPGERPRGSPPSVGSGTDGADGTISAVPC